MKTSLIKVSTDQPLIKKIIPNDKTLKCIYILRQGKNPEMTLPLLCNLNFYYQMGKENLKYKNCKHIKYYNL